MNPSHWCEVHTWQEVHGSEVDREFSGGLLFGVLLGMCVCGVCEGKEAKPPGRSQDVGVGYPYKCTERCSSSIFLLLQNMGLAILETPNNVCKAHNTVNNN